MSWMQHQARQTFFAAAARIRHGSLDIVCPDRTHQFGQPGTGPAAMLVVHDERVFLRALTGGDMALGEAFVDGDFSSPDLVALLRLAVRNMAVFHALNGPWSWLSRQVASMAHWRRRNTKAGSRKNIAAHYDLGNDFFALFLDRTLMYSSAVFERPDMTLEEASVAKLDRICRKLELKPGDRVLEIGTGWGGFALHAARRYGCKVTSTTISRAQHDLAARRIEAAGLTDRVTLLLQDYRELGGRYDKLVSIEMIEAVGHQYFDAYFKKCGELLERDGLMLLQGITIADQRYAAARDSVDFIKRYIFPGCCIPSLSVLANSVARMTDMRVFDVEDIGPHYATTLKCWRENLMGNLEQVHALGYSGTFVRMWEFYLCYCEAGFAERVLGDAQMLLMKPGARPGRVVANQ